MERNEERSDDKRKLNIVVYMIHKNEADKAIEAIRSAQEADMVYVFDTGSTEEQIEKLNNNELYFEYGELTVSPWRFDVARNAALALIPGDVDVCVALDADEVLAPGWRQEIEKVWIKGETTVLRYMYDWSQGMVFPQAKIHAREGYHWVYAAHERLHYYPPNKKEVFATTDKFLMYHHPDLTKNRGSYLPLLHMAYIEYPTHKQVVFYFGRELWKAGLNEPATKVLTKYLTDCGAEENAETAYACRILGQLTDLAMWFKMGIDHMPTHREPYIWYADWLYKNKRYEEAHDQTAIALGIKERTTDYTVESRCWDGYPYHLLSWCTWHMGFKELAIEGAEEALKMEPNNDAYQKSLEYFQNAESESPPMGMDKVEKETKGT